MAKIEKLEFSISLRDLPEKILVPRVALTRPDLVFERLPDNRKNWILSDPSDTSPSKLRISTLSVDHGHLRYIDHGEPFDARRPGQHLRPGEPGEGRRTPMPGPTTTATRRSTTSRATTTTPRSRATR